MQAESKVAEPASYYMFYEKGLEAKIDCHLSLQKAAQSKIKTCEQREKVCCPFKANYRNITHWKTAIVFGCFLKRARKRQELSHV
jgi:hypothetical protein